MSAPDSEQTRHYTASRALQDVVDNNTNDLISLYELKASLHQRGFGLVLLFFSLPIIFVPPGLTLFAALPVLMFSGQMLFGMDSPWLPRWLAQKQLKRSTLAMLVEKTSPYLKRAERFLRPRIEFASTRTGEKIIGFFAVMFSLSIAIPLPLTNLVPAIAIAVMALGLLSRDGLTIIAGAIIGTLGCCVTLMVLILGQKAVTAFFREIMIIF
jgi:hypothetical protein